MGLIGKIGDLLGGAFGLVDDLHTSDEERLQLKASLLTIQSGVISEVIKAEAEISQARAAVITAEASSSHWVTATWRPITMLTFLVLIVAAQFGFTQPIPEQMWPLLTLGIGGYVGGRTVEKAASSVAATLKTKDQT